MSDFDYKEGDEFEVSPKEASKVALKILAAGGTYTIDGSIIKITSLPEDKPKKAKVEEKKAEVAAKVEEKKVEVEEKKAEEPKAKPVAPKPTETAKTENKE